MSPLRSIFNPHILAVGLVLGCAALAGAAQSSIKVTTLGGGPIEIGGPYYGDLDGPTLEQAQFHSPWACATDTLGNLYVADRDNGKIRKLNVAGDLTRTFISGLAQPVGLAIDPDNNVYVVCQGTASVLKYDRFGPSYPLGANLNSPTAIALKIDANNQVSDIYVTELGIGANGALKRIDPVSQLVAIVLNGLNQPRGLALLDNGLLAVSETGAHTVRLVNPATGLTVRQIGAQTAGPGFQDGPIAMAKFNAPHHLAKAPNGSLVVADRGNDCVRLISADGFVTTLYGIDPVDWGFDNPTPYLGWWDGSPDVAESREPAGVAVGADGTVYTTEVYYHIVREVTGANLSGSSGGGGTNTVVKPPIISVPGISLVAGYYPSGLTIYVTNLNDSSLAPTAVYYTTDGTEPTTNSLQVIFQNGVGTIIWTDPLHDLSDLRVIAFVGTVGSSVVAGQTVTQSGLVIPRDVQAGVGATIVMPIVANLKTNEELRSLQYRVEITPVNTRPGIKPVVLDGLSFTNVPFIPFVGPTDPDKTALFQTDIYANGNASGAYFAFVGTNSSFHVPRFGVVNLLAVTLPADALEGDRYQVSILDPSGTSDGLSAAINLNAGSVRILTVTNLAYLVGESSPASWYEAGEFGQGTLKNSDVNNAFYASLGIRVPFAFSDVYDAMDVFPLDSTTLNTVGGDGQIRFLDWQTILMRSLRWPGFTQNFQRSRNANGVRIVKDFSGPVSAQALQSVHKAAAQTSSPIWDREVLVGVLPVENAPPGQSVHVPVYIVVRPGCQISGLQFRVQVNPQGTTPSLNTPVQFIRADSLPTPTRAINFSNNDFSCAWDMNAFTPPLTGSNYLGSLSFTIPMLALPGQSYMVRFANADGAPDFRTQYNFETLPAVVWIASGAQQARQLIPDEWKVHFYGSYTNPLAADDADPDQDGVTNLQAYRTGINPVPLRLLILAQEWQGELGMAGFTLRWYGAPGQHYSVETATNALTTLWSVVQSNIAGVGNMLELVDTNRLAPRQYYRVKQQP